MEQNSLADLHVASATLLRLLSVNHTYVSKITGISELM